MTTFLFFGDDIFFCGSPPIYRPHDISKTKSIESKSLQSFHKQSNRSLLSELIPKFILGGVGVNNNIKFHEH